MRELKFRAWGCFGSDRKPSMVYDWQDSGYIEYVGFNGGDSFEIMQYTGLKDKNGKEIYESDILRCQWQEKEIGVIGWHGSGFWIQWPSKSRTMPSEENREVIGNIYENPELLNEQKRD